MLAWPGLAAINHVLRGADWARERLAPFSGRIIRIEVTPFAAIIRIEADGTLSEAPNDSVPIASVRLGPITAARLLIMHDETARKDVQVDGDAALAAALTGVLTTIRWDVEEDLSRVVGDIAAHRMVDAGSGFVRWQASAAANLAQSVSEFITHERPLVASREAVSDFVQAVDAIRDDVERLEKRIEKIEQTQPVPVDSKP
jgi:ubiquinone biosynthesis protein UbiJ